MTTVHDLGESTPDRVIFRRPDETIYAVLSMKRIRELRKKNRLEKFLDAERETGIIIELNDEN